MQSMTRRSISKASVALTATASVGITNTLRAEPLVNVPGIQLYTVDKELKAGVEGTLKKVRMKVPAEPVIFTKATSAVCGPNDNIVIPLGSTKTDWEVELSVVIGAPAKHVSEENALSHVAGYCIINDVSERAFQLEDTGPWTKGTSADTFGPIGPWLVTTDEIPDPQNLDMWLEADGRRFQNGNTRTMVSGVAHLISYLSHYKSLQPGDIISTGTPPGVGMGQLPPIYLSAGNNVQLAIDGLGVQHQSVLAAPLNGNQGTPTSGSVRTEVRR